MSRQQPRGLGEQIGATKASFGRLWRAHVNLLKTELNEIVGQLKLIATQAGILLGIALMTSTLLYVGGWLFLGEWLFGSIGWGLAHGLLFGIALIVILAFAILGARGRTAVVSFFVALLVIVGVALLCGSNVAYNAASSIAASLGSPLNSPPLVALLAGALFGAILFSLMFARIAGRGGFIGGLLLGAILGMPVGWLIGGAPWTWPPAVGFAMVIGLIAWPVLHAVIAWPGLDPGERFKKLYPQQSIDAAQETKAWLQEQLQARKPGVPGR
jgi:hypothetical protein